jgi:CHAT domain-containing protein
MKYTTLPVMLILILLTGCVTVAERESLVYSANYGEVAKLVESEIRETGIANSAKLRALCDAYSALKRYDRLFECCDRLEANIRRGDKYGIDLDKTVAHDPLFGNAPREMYARTALVFWEVSSWPFVLRAQAYLELGQYAKAIEEAKKAYVMVPLSSMEKTTQIRVLGVMGLAYALNGDREKALQAANRLDKGDLSLHGISTIDRDVALARIYLGLKDYPRALEAIRRESTAWQTFQEIPRDFMLNKCLMETGQANEAKSGYDTLLQLPQTKDSGEIYWMILFDRGRIEEKEGNLKNAVMFYRKAVEVIEQERASINTEASKIGFVGDKQGVYFRLVHCLCAEGQFEPAFEYVERSKARAFVDMLASKKDFAIKDGNKQVVQALLDDGVKTEAELRVRDESIDKSKLRSIEIKNREKLIEQSPELASFVSVRSFSSGDIRSSIPGNETLVEYYYEGKDLFIFVLSRSVLTAFRSSSDNLELEIRELRTSLQRPDSEGYLELCRRLYEKLIKPIEGSLKDRNLIIVPHGALHYLPFNVLCNEKGYLIERHNIRLLPSSSIIKYLRPSKTPKQSAILVFGNPDLGSPDYDLKYAQNEAIEVAKSAAKSRLLLRRQATETAFRKYGQDFNYIHFATHGKFDPDDSLNSAILLSGDSENNGILTTDKLYSMRIDADLVTLSACETGLGKISNGDDVVGLTRGFLYAGSTAVVATLWKVDDQATSDLMSRFYDNLSRYDKREALIQAQLQIKSRYAHPFYWAAFQIIGNEK